MSLDTKSSVPVCTIFDGSPLLVPLLLVATELVDQTGEQDEDVLRQQGNSKPAILFFCRGFIKS